MTMFSDTLLPFHKKHAELCLHKVIRNRYRPIVHHQFSRPQNRSISMWCYLILEQVDIFKPQNM
ncbi:hypothetical protein ACS0TY_000098 [Phlomoides rotata]